MKQGNSAETNRELVPGPGSVRELRELAGVSLHQAAARIGISYASMWRFEKGYARLAPEQQKALTDFLLETLQQRTASVCEAFGAAPGDGGKDG